MIEAPALDRRKSTLLRIHLATTVLSWLVILGMIGAVLAPTLADPSAGGSHDWEQMESHRYLVTKTIRGYHQFPFWNPYACGGHPSWGGFESGVTVVSPWFPFYLWMSLAHAMRVEVFGSALISAIGAWMLAGRFSLSPALRALVVVVFAVNGRWALQMSVGHTWHLAYAWTPWSLYFYDRAAGADPTRGAPRLSDVVLMGACLGIMVYTGGIYPLPQTIFLIALYGVFLSAVTRSFRPTLVVLAGGLLAFGLAAPKLLPVIDVLRNYPRITDSIETLDLTTFFQILTAHDQDTTSHPANVSQWAWHEWGMYVGWPVVTAMIAGALVGRGVRESPLKWAGLVAMLLGFGAFDPHAPWTLLHRFPVFMSQHVPSRWQYPGLLLLLVVTAAAFDRIFRHSGRVRGWLEVAAFAGAVWTAYDVGKVASQPVRHAFAVPMPTVPESMDPFHTEVHVPAELTYSASWSSPSLTAELANIGTIDCGTFPGFHNYYRNASGHVHGLGAHGRGDPAYKGETFIAEGLGNAMVLSFTPNAVAVLVTGARTGEHVVLNQNWDAGWTANGAPALNMDDTVAAPLEGPEATVVFRYRPRLWNAALVIFGATIGGIGYAFRLERKARRMRRKSTPN